jgi:hypothetical protein
VQVHSIEIANDGLVPLEAGARYWYRARSTVVNGPPVRAVRADARSATLEGDVLHPSVVSVGDELHVTDYVRRVSVYGALSGGRARTGEGTSTVAGGSIMARWSFDRIPLMAELGVHGDLLPHLGTSRAGLGGAAGVRLPLGPIHPVGFIELGVDKAFQDGAKSTGAYAGLGAGLECWFSSVFVFADIRARSYWMGDWNDGSEDMVPMPVTHSDLDTRSLTVQLAIGRIY